MLKRAVFFEVGHNRPLDYVVNFGLIFPICWSYRGQTGKTEGYKNPNTNPLEPVNGGFISLKIPYPKCDPLASGNLI